LRIASTAKEIAFPVAGDRAFLDGRRAITNRYCIDDPVSGLPFIRGRSGASHYAARAEMVLKLLFQRASGLDEQRSVDRLMGNLQISIRWRLRFEPTRYLLRRPLQLQFAGNDPAQLGVR
jgi:hypothetical protein